MNQKPYFLRSIALAFVMLMGGYVANAQSYCVPTYTLSCTGSTFIDDFSTSGGITNITNNNTGCGNTNSYSNYTGNASMKVTQDAGSSVSLTINLGPNSGTAGTYLSRVEVYVDWNQDGDFVDAGELAGSINAMQASGSSGSVNVTVPLTAKNGLTRMRIRSASRKNIPEPASTFSPCANHQEGEAEDYNFEVINPCLPPTALSVSGVTYKTATISWTGRPNAKLYEYYFTNNKSNVPPTSIGYHYTSATTLSYENLTCDTMYYIYVRSVCDTTGITMNWDTSGWVADSFRTDPCCYKPEVKIENVTSSTAIARWDPVGSAYGYEYIVSTKKDIPQVIQGTYTTYTSAFLQGLSGSTLYYFHVRSRCSPTPLSVWDTKVLQTQPALSVNSVNGSNVFELAAYPNPVTDLLTVDINGSIAGNATVWLMDITGKAISSTPVTQSKVSIDMSNLPSGVYTIKYVDDEHNKVMKVNKH